MSRTFRWMGWLGLGALTLSTACFIFLGFTTRGTVDGGDSIFHYFHVERTTQDFSSALRLWAKPFYTLIAAPAVALGGFTGLKLFNILSAMAALAGASLIARKLSWKGYGFLPFLGLAAAAFPTYAFSGLTESFASLLLIASILALLYERPALAYLLASLLPYCRSEAKILLPLFLLYGLYHRHFRQLPLLAAGSLIFSMLGAYYLDDWAWIFESPYQLDNDYYGHGSWLHYLKQLVHLLYGPLTILTAMGVLLGLYRAWRSPAYRRHTWLLVHLPALAILAGHTTVWALGIYASAGLARVLVFVLPLYFIITLECLEAFYHGATRLNKKLGLGLVVVLVALCAWLPYERGNAPYHWKTALERSPRHQLVQDSIAPYIKAHHAPFNRLVSDEPLLGLALGINMVDSKRIKSWRLMAQNANLFNHEKDLLLWDNRWLTQLKPGPAELAQDPCWHAVKKWAIQPLGKRQEFILYERDPACSTSQKAP